MLTYVGSRDEHGIARVHVVDEVGRRRPLCLFLRIRDHSPNGFEWGYGGSGPAQLALAMCFHATRDQVIAETVYQTFKWRYVGNFPAVGWSMTEHEVTEAIGRILLEAAGADPDALGRLAPEGPADDS